jgi:hypothetical protein
MDRKTIRLQARLGAIEYMIAGLFKKFYEINDVSLKQVQKEHEFLRTYLQKMTPPTDPRSRRQCATVPDL